MPITQREKASRFLELHQGPRILVLPNAWDAASARIFETSGFPAMGTTSAGIANSLGFPDGQLAPREEVFAITRRIVSAVDIPVSADIEAAYGANSVEDAVATIREVLDIGAVGVNIEDSDPLRAGALVDVAMHVAKIRAIRAMAGDAGIPLVINARTDAYHISGTSPEDMFKTAVERGNTYLQEGADCVFVPFLADGPTIAKLARAIDGPINVLMMPGTPPVAELEQMGVRRVSSGSGPFRAALSFVQRLANELHTSGSFDAIVDDTISYPDANLLFER